VIVTGLAEVYGSQTIFLASSDSTHGPYGAMSATIICNFANAASEELKGTEEVGRGREG
jgi:hypothetical protein